MWLNWRNCSWIFILVSIFYSKLQVREEFDVWVLNASFLDVDWVPWEETANLTAGLLQNICEQILPFLISRSNASISNFTYEPVLTSEIRSKRWAKNTLLPLENTNDIAHVPVLKCFYKEIKFYLTHADDDKVYELKCESAEQEIYTLKSGPYPVQYVTWAVKPHFLTYMQFLTE